MTQYCNHDAVVVGSGPNGLSAAITLAQAGRSVLVLESQHTIGGGARSAPLTEPGFIHDVCSAIHPLAIGSPFFRTLPLEGHGLRWVHPIAPLAHPLDDGTAVLLHRSVAETAAGLGRDAQAYRRLMEPLAGDWETLAAEFLRPLIHAPRHPWILARFGLLAMRSAASLARGWFGDEPARALFAGLAAHSFLPLTQSPSAAFGLVLGLMGHAVGWPFPEGGAQQISNALAAVLGSLGGRIIVNQHIDNLEELPPARVRLLDLTPAQLLPLAGARLPPSYRRALMRFRYGPAAFKLDYALRGPIPWRAAACARAGTVHLGGTLSEIAAAEQAVAEGRVPAKPFVLLAQHSLFDPTRAPAGRHTAWVYGHVPHACGVDVTRRIEDQIERFAPGFRDQILHRHTMNPAKLQEQNPNLIGGDINGGLANLRQLLARPVLSLSPYRIPIPGLYLCSSSTPPGGGVHGMCGYHAARAALKHEFSP